MEVLEWKKQSEIGGEEEILCYSVGSNRVFELEQSGEAEGGQPSTNLEQTSKGFP